MTTHQDTSTERDQFERAYSEQYPVTVLTTANLFERAPTGDYTRTPTQVGWRMWQAALASRDEVAQQPQGQSVSDEGIEKLAMKAGAQHDCMDRLCLKGIDEIKRFRAILALRDKPEQRMPLSDERLAEVLTAAYGSPEWTMDDVRAARAVEAACLGITAKEPGRG